VAITEAFTNTATIGATEYSLPNNSTTLTARTDAGMFEAFIDLNAMTATEQYQVRIYEKTISGGTQRLIWETIVTGAQTWPILVLPSLILLWGWDITVKKLAGTDRSIVWSIRKVA
jgi:hypothetical protein